MFSLCILHQNNMCLTNTCSGERILRAFLSGNTLSCSYAWDRLTKICYTVSTMLTITGISAFTGQGYKIGYKINSVIISVWKHVLNTSEHAILLYQRDNTMAVYHMVFTLCMLATQLKEFSFPLLSSPQCERTLKV